MPSKAHCNVTGSSYPRDLAPRPWLRLPEAIKKGPQFVSDNIIIGPGLILRQPVAPKIHEQYQRPWIPLIFLDLNTIQKSLRKEAISKNQV